MLLLLYTAIVSILLQRCRSWGVGPGGWTWGAAFAWCSCVS
nr:MAG TPA: hypothetical protein [Caudoviricetes sp.]